MYDKDLITKVCNLTCSKKDLSIDQRTINYDIESPFKKYYDVNTIIGAINKYLSREWDDDALAKWCCIYCWILCGGFHDDLKENLNSLEEYLVELITDDLDGLSFFEEEDRLSGVIDVYERIEGYKNLDHVWQTRNKWKGVYSSIKSSNNDGFHQYIVLINEKEKEYMIFYEDFLEDEPKQHNKYFKYIEGDEFIKLIDKMKEDEYSIIKWHEEYYYLYQNNVG